MRMGRSLSQHHSPPDLRLFPILFIGFSRGRREAACLGFIAHPKPLLAHFERLELCGAFHPPFCSTHIPAPSFPIYYCSSTPSSNQFSIVSDKSHDLLPLCPLPTAPSAAIPYKLPPLLKNMGARAYDVHSDPVELL